MFFHLFALSLGAPREDYAVSLGVVAPWYGVPLFDQLLFALTDYSESNATAFLTAAIQAGQLDDEVFLWEAFEANVDRQFFALARAHVKFGFYLPRAEL
jgi:hypothetical protein